MLQFYSITNFCQLLLLYRVALFHTGTFSMCVSAVSCSACDVFVTCSCPNFHETRVTDELIEGDHQLALAGDSHLSANAS